METVVTYMLKLITCSGILYLYYFFALRSKRFHRYNRFYLLASFALSLLIPLLHFNWIHLSAEQNFPTTTFAHAILSEKALQPVHASSITGILYSVYTSISVLLIIVFLAKINWIYKTRKAGRRIPMHGFRLIEVNVSEAPFSFLNNLFWRKGMSLTDVNGRRIFMHELCHIKQGHSYDSLLIQLILCICWINPFFWLLRKELNVIHEFIADAAAIDDGDAESFASMLLHTYNEGRHLSPAHSFFNSSIKRRLAMIQSSKTTSCSYLRRVMSLPIAIFLLALFSLTVTAQTRIDDVANNDSRSARIVDHIEVHGQTGIGDTGIVYFKNGAPKKYVLNNAAENKLFQEKYGALLKRQSPVLPPHEEAVMSAAAIDYEPLHPIPETISEITFGTSIIWLKRKDGNTEEYDLRNSAERKDFEAKYGKLNTRKQD